MSRLTKQEVAEDLSRVYKQAMNEIKAKRTVMIEDKQGVRVSPEWVVIKEAITLLNRIDMIVDEEKVEAELQLN